MRERKMGNPAHMLTQGSNEPGLSDAGLSRKQDDLPLTYLRPLPAIE